MIYCNEMPRRRLLCNRTNVDQVRLKVISKYMAYSTHLKPNDSSRTRLPEQSHHTVTESRRTHFGATARGPAGYILIHMAYINSEHAICLQHLHSLGDQFIMAPYKVAVLDDYQGLSKAKFAKLDAAKVEVTYFSDTLPPYNHSDTPQSMKDALVERLEPFQVICTTFP